MVLALHAPEAESKGVS